MRIMDIVVGGDEDGFGEFAEGGDEFFEGLEVFAPADFEAEGFQVEQILGQIPLFAGELGIGEPKDDAVGLEGLFEEGIDGELDEVDAGGERGEGNNQFVFVALGVGFDADFCRFPAVPRPITQFHLLAPDFAATGHDGEA